MDENGLFPLELARTTSLHYSVFIMNAFTIIAQLSENTQTNFWNVETASGKSFKKAFDALMPFITQEKQWTGTQIKEFNYRDAFPLIIRCNEKFDCKDCMEVIKKIAGEQYDSLLLNLL